MGKMMAKIYEASDKDGKFGHYLTLIANGIMSIDELANKALYGKPYQINFAVSRFQGDYAWSDDDIMGFLKDLSERVNDKKPYFVGVFTFVFQKKCIKILDGRHRLIVIVLLLLALGDKTMDLIMNFDDMGGKERIMAHLELVRAWCKDKFADKQKGVKFALNLRQKVLFIGFQAWSLKDAAIFYSRKKGLGTSGFVGTKTPLQGAFGDLSVQNRAKSLQRKTNGENRISPHSLGSLTFHQFEIPRYHRLYEWQSKHINAFLRDIKRAFMHTTKLYIGAIITAYQLDSREAGIYVLLDGVQRLMTLWFVCFYMANLKPLGRWANRYKRLIFYAHGDELRFVAPAQSEFGRVLSEFAKTNYDLSVFKHTNLACIQNAFDTIRRFFERCEKAGVDMEKFAIFIYELVEIRLVKLALDDDEARHFCEKIQRV